MFSSASFVSGSTYIGQNSNQPEMFSKYLLIFYSLQLAYMFHSVCDIWMSVDGQVWAEMGKRALENVSIACPSADPMDAKREEKKSQTMNLAPPTILSLILGMKTMGS